MIMDVCYLLVELRYLHIIIAYSLFTLLVLVTVSVMCHVIDRQLIIVNIYNADLVCSLIATCTSARADSVRPDSPVTGGS